MLWSLDAIQATLECMKHLTPHFRFPDNMEYFFDKVGEIMHQNYTPTTKDMLKARIQTNGINGFDKHVYEAKEDRFEIYDVNGQRNERYTVYILYTIYKYTAM